MQYSNKWDLTTIPGPLLMSEMARRNGALRKAKGGPKPILKPCPRCGKVLSAVERRKACPAH